MSDDFLENTVEMQMPVRTLLEADVQGTCVEWARRRGWWARKISSPANRALTDYVFGKMCWAEWIEFKKPGRCQKNKERGLSKDQIEEHEKMRAAGMRPVVFDNVDAFKEYMCKVEARIAKQDWALIASWRGLRAQGLEGLK